MAMLELSEVLDHLAHAVLEVALPALFAWFLYELRGYWQRIRGRLKE